MKKIRKGFTLVEVICVLTIIAIIAAIAVPNISGYIEKSKINNCRSIMTDFVNDLEYKIVSKRYYDINELNDELVGYVKNSSAVEPEIESKETDNSRTTSVKAKICPNDGTYELSWTISPNIDSKSGETDIYTAKVNVSECVCKCVGTGENAVVHTGHEFTAALVASEYIDSGKTQEQKYEEIINIIIKDVEKSEAGAGDLAGIVNEVEGKNPGYEIAGLTTTLDKKVEWISVYYHDTFSAEESKYKFLTRSEGKLIVKDLTEEEFNNKSNWPSAEGTCGSAVYKEGWNATCYVGGLNNRDANNQEIGWIQRDGNWYVQKSNNVKGIDFTVDENSNLSGYPLLSDDGCNLNNDKKLVIQTKSGADVSNIKDSVSNIKNALQVTAEYENGNKVIFDHISATDLTKEDYFIKNGFIIVSSDSEVSWAGIYENSTSAGSEKATLKSLIDDEDKLIEDFLSGKNLSGKKSELIIAYQEYYKTYNAETKVYSSVPVTCFGKLSREYNAETGNAEIKNEEGEVIFKIEETQNDGYEVNYNQSPESNNMFRVEDLSVKRTVTYVVKDTNGNTVYSFKGSGVDIKHVEENDNSGSLGFYVGDYGGYTKEKEISGVKNINIVGSQTKTTWIFLNNDINNPIATITTDNTNYYWTYKKNENDTEFDIGKINVTISYPVNVSSHRLGVTVKTNGAVTYTLNHRTNESSDFYYYVTDNYIDNQDTWDPDKEADIIKNINSFSTKAYIKVFKNYDHNYNHKRIANIESYLDSVTADYTNDGGAFSFDKLTASAHYVIDLIDSVNNSNKVAQIKHPVPLNHDDNSNNRYYISLGYCNDDWNENNYVKTNEQETIAEIHKKTECTAYVVFCDKRTRCDDIYINIKSSTNPPDVVYIPDSDGSTDAHMIAYIGTNQNVTVPASHTGYWSLSEPASDLNFIKKEVNIQSVGPQTYYFIDDGKTYNIKRIGADSSALPQGNEDSIKIKFASGVKVQSLDISEGVEEIGPYAFSKLSMEGEGSIKIPDSVETIGFGAFADCGSNYFKKLEIGTVTESNGDFSSSSKLKTIGASAFQNCNSLTATDVIVIPESVTSIGQNAFNKFRLSNATLVLNGISEYKKKNNSTNTFTENNVNSSRALAANEVDYEGVITKNIFGDGNQLTVNALIIGGKVERIDNETFMRTQFNSDTSSVVIKGNVETIGASAFQESNFASKLVIGDKVKYIEASAFEGCSTYSGTLNLNKVVKIGQNAFKGCTNITGGLVIPETMEFIGQYAFDSFALNHSFDIVNNECKVGELVIKGGSLNQGHTLGGFIFTNAKFKNLKIEGTKITEISAYAFKNSPINRSTPYNDIKGSLEISGSVKTIGKSAFENCNGFTGDLILPEGLTVINDATFNGCLGFTGDLNIPSTVTQIGSRAFMGCVGMNGSLTLSNNLKKIGMEAFKDCINFKNGLKIPETVTEGIGNCAFQRFAKNTSEQGLLEINAGSYSNGTKLGGFIFTEAKFNGVTVGGIVQEISANAFHHEQSDELELNYYDPDDPDNKSTTSTGGETNTPSGGETTTEGSLSKTTLKADYSGITGSLVVETSVTKIDDCAFYNCEGLNAVSFNAKKQSNSNSYTYSDTEGLEYIGEGAFRGCVNVGGNLIIPKTVTLIETCAFKMFGNGSGSLVIHGGSYGNKLGYVPEGKTYFPIFPSSKFNGVTIGGNVTEICDGFMNNNLNSFLNHTEGSEEYRTYDYNDIKGGLCIESSVEKIGGYAFQECKFDGDIEFKLPADSKTRTVGKECFKGCSDITGNLDLSRVTEIGDSAFYGCSKIQSVNLYDGLTRIGDDAFNRCSGAGNDLYIPRTVTYIGRCAFKYYGNGNGNLKVYGGSEGTVLGNKSRNTQEAVDPIFPSASFKSVTIGGNVTKIYGYLFNNVSNHYEMGTTNVNDTYNYDNLKGSLTIENSVTLIGERAFLGCNFDGDLKIEEKGDSDKEGLKTIEKEAFAKVEFNNVNIPSTVTEIGDMAFWDSGNGNGKLVIDGCTDTSGNLGYTDRKSNIFVGAKYNGVKIGGSVKNISDNFMHNMLNSSADGSKFTYDGVEYWYDYTHITGGLSLSNSVETIGVSAFESCAFTGRLILGENTDSRSASEPKLREIGNYAFKNCENMSGTLVIPYTMKSMGRDAFYRFAASVNPEDAGALIIWGGSSNNGSSINQEIFIGSQFKDVFISGTVNRIEDRAFINENNDKNRLYDKWSGTLAIGRGVDYIGNEAFKNCPFDGQLNLRDDSYVSSQQSTSEPRPLTIGANAFAGCTKFYDNFNGGQAEFIVPESVVSIGEHAFSGMCSSDRDSSKIPALKILGTSNPDDKGAFGSKAPLENNKYPTIQIFDKAQFKNVTIGGKVKVLAEDAFNNNNGAYSKLKGNLTIESTVDYVWKRAFYNCSGFDGVLTLGFDYNPETATMNDGIQKIGTEAFAGCSKFSGGLSIPASVYSIEEKAFESFAANTSSPGKLNIEGYSSTVNRALETDSHSNTVTLNQIDAKIFNNSKFHDVSVGWNVQSIADNFMMTNKSYNYDYTKISGSLYIGQNVVYIGTSAFSMRNAGGEGGFDGTLTFNTNNSYYKTISNDAFYGQKFTGDLILPHSLYVIKDSAFEECRGFNGKLEFEYADGGGTMRSVAKIGNYAFKNCVNFYTNPAVERILTIPETVLAIGNETNDSDAFYSFASNGDGPELKLYAGSHDNGTTLKKGIFKNAKFHNVTIGGKITTIDSEAFKSDYGVYNGLTGDLTIEENTVQTIKNGAFQNANGFDGTLYLGSVKTIGANAFNNCINFSGGLVIPYGMNGIGDSAFYKFASNTQNPGPFDIWSGTEVSNGFQILDGAPFRGAKFKDMIVHGSVNSIKANAFNSWGRDTGEDFRNFTGSLSFKGTTEIGDYAFFMATGFDGALNLKGDREGVTTIGANAFAECSNFYKNGGTFTVPGCVTSIGQFAFNGLCKDAYTPPSLVINGTSGTAKSSVFWIFGSNVGRSIDQKIFTNSKFHNITIGGEVKMISNNAFRHDGTNDFNYSLWSGTLTVDSTVSVLFEDSFYNNYNFDLISIPSGIKVCRANGSPEVLYNKSEVVFNKKGIF